MHGQRSSPLCIACMGGSSENDRACEHVAKRLIIPYTGLLDAPQLPLSGSDALDSASVSNSTPPVLCILPAHDEMISTGMYQNFSRILQQSSGSAPQSELSAT